MTCPRLSRLAALLPVAFLAMPALALAAPATADGHPAVRQFGACLAAQKTGELLLLMDQSASLKTTDPTGIRASAASYLLGQLAGSTAATNVTLDVAIAGFDVGYRSYVDWTKLNTSSVERLQQSVDSFRSRHGGRAGGLPQPCGAGRNVPGGAVVHRRRVFHQPAQGWIHQALRT
jgi:hypothetical protein